MAKAATQPEAERQEPRWSRGLAVVAILLAVIAAYANSLSGPPVYDDLKSIALNPSIRQLGTSLSPPVDSGLSGRPAANLTFALNHALGGSVRGYHLLNLAIHGLAALVLFGVVRRTLLRPGLRERLGGEASLLAWAVALLWAVHPLQTEAVTYLSQRTEELMGLCYLLTLYGFIRGVESPAPRGWFGLSVLACLFGAATKEVIVTAPLAVLLYDRTFVSGTFREAWRRHRGWYLGLAASWLLLAWLMRGLASRHVGYGLGVSAWDYALTECRAVALYLRLSLWPGPQVFDYGPDLAPFDAVTWAAVLLVAGFLAVAIRAVWRRSALGFVGGWIFLTLAPTSSVVPVALQPVAEHRMYLALAGVLTLVVLGLHALIGRRITVLVLVLAVVLGVQTAQRNAVYRSEVTLWEDTVAQRPGNPRAQTNLGTALARSDRLGEARAHFAAAEKLRPGEAMTHYNLGNALLGLDQPKEALEHCQMAVKLAPNSAEAHNALGAVLATLGRYGEAREQFEAALRLQPGHVAARANLGRLPPR